MPFLFIFDTMRSGYSNNMFLQDSTLVGNGKTTNKYQLCMKNDEVRLTNTKSSIIEGEIYEVTESKLKSVDVMEGIGAGGGKRKVSECDSDSGSEEIEESYKVVRKETQIQKDDGTTIEAFIYITSLDGAVGWETITSGNIITSIPPDGDTPSDGDNDDDDDDDDDEGGQAPNYRDTAADSNLPTSVTGVADMMQMMENQK
eukprot:TRINITY_DN6417_c0_g1_i1.p1 TRINITY_DN6417_c0_g1~~TRINITY_DN6417_c0_g1_i1.p1  ORF type:complete len:201 (+),score=53.50 TRINITY_DN6417_c0_g1_i1:165-767(+)